MNILNRLVSITGSKVEFSNQNFPILSHTFGVFRASLSRALCFCHATLIHPCSLLHSHPSSTTSSLVAFSCFSLV